MRLVAALALGVIGGYVSLALALVGLVLVVILTALVVAVFKRFIVALGLYLASLGATGTVILLGVVIGSQPCQGEWIGPDTSSVSCYAPSTVPALAACSGILITGLVLAGFSLAGRPRKWGGTP
jgi:hypothetical protein